MLIKINTNYEAFYRLAYVCGSEDTNYHSCMMGKRLEIENARLIINDMFYTLNKKHRVRVSAQSWEKREK